MQDNVMPTGKWEFNEEVTQCFDEMLMRSIPAYTDMRDLVHKIGEHYVTRSTAIVDIGCSTGEAVKPFIREHGAQNQFKLFDVSEPMLDECKRRYAGWMENGIVDVQNFDIRNGVPEHIFASLELSILTLQFTPIEYRQKIVQSIYNTLIGGGAFILVEKVLGNTYDLDSVMIDEYYAIKAENAYTEEQISAKRKSLEGVLVPITADWNEQMLRNAGFKQVDCFWRYLNFAGWVAVK